MTKRDNPVSSSIGEKRPKFDAKQGEQIFNVEHCNIHRRPGFTVKTIAYNATIGRLCVVRKLDSVGGQKDPGQPVHFSVVEFYNALRPPLIFLEKSIPVTDSFEAVVWMGSWAILGALGGRATFLSPFTSRFGRIQMCTTDILVMTLASETQFVIGNNSSELLVVNRRRPLEDESKEEERIKVPAFSTVQTLKLSSDEHITALACSKSMMEPEMMAVGKVNGLSLFVQQKGQWRKHREVAISQQNTKANIIWSLIFVDNFLFAGDARGQVCIYNAESGSLLKALKTHQAPVLAMATDGKEVFAAGTDYRIQVITSVSHEDVRFDWQQRGQRLFHSNDVRVLCVLDKQWLVSGGAEHDLFVSNKFHYSNPQIKSECSFSRASPRHGLIVTRHLFHLDLWCKAFGRSNGQMNSPILKLLMKITSGKCGLIKHLCISPNGNFVAFAGAVDGAIRILRINNTQIQNLVDNPKSIEGGNGHDNLVELHWNNLAKQPDELDKGGSKAISAMFCTDKYLYFVRGEYKVIRFDLHNKRMQILSAKDNGGHLIKICVDREERSLVALTMDAPLYFDLISAPGLVRLDFLSKSPLFDCVFVNSGQVLFLTTDLNQHIILYDLPKRAKMATFGRKKLKLAMNEWIAYMDVDGKNRVITMSNKGRLRMIVLEGLNLRVFMNDQSEDVENDEVARCVDTRIEPFSCGTNSSIQSSIVLVKHIQENPPSQSPYRLKFFGKN